MILLCEKLHLLSRHQTKFFLNRMLLAAFVANLVWLSSWTICSFVSSFSVSVPSKQLKNQVQRQIFFLVQEELQLQSTSVHYQMGNCFSSLEQKLKREHHQVRTTQEHNQKVMSNAKALYERDHAYLGTLHAELAARFDREGSISFLNHSVCSDHQRTYHLANIRSASVHYSPEELAFDFVSAGLETSNNLSKYFEDRVSYDYEYFVQNHTKQIMNYLLSLNPQQIFIKFDTIFEQFVSEIDLLFLCILPMSARQHIECLQHNYSLSFKASMDTHFIEPMESGVKLVTENVEIFELSITQLADELEYRTNLLNALLQGKQLIEVAAYLFIHSILLIFSMMINSP